MAGKSAGRKSSGRKSADRNAAGRKSAGRKQRVENRQAGMQRSHPPQVGEALEEQARAAVLTKEKAITGRKWTQAS